MDSDLRAAMAGHVTQQEAYARSAAGSAPLTAAEFHRVIAGVVGPGSAAISGAEKQLLQRNLDMAAKAQRRADLVTLTGHVMAGMLASIAGPNVEPMMQTAFEQPLRFAEMAVNTAEAALALIEERTK